jgi:hypothetical protein
MVVALGLLFHFPNMMLFPLDFRVLMRARCETSTSAKLVLDIGK